jgi:transposase
LGRRALLRHPHGNREGFLATLRHLRRRLRGYTIWLYVDRARWHKGLPVDTFLNAHQDLHLEYLPAYQPGLNVEERIWRQVRYDATSNQYFDTLDDMWTSLRTRTRR